MLSGFVLLLTAQNPTLDFRCKATDIRTVLAQLSEKTGTKLQAEGLAAKQIVLIDVDDVTLADLKERIAKAVAGKWEKREDREILLRTPLLQNQVINTYVERRKKHFEAEQAKVSKALEKPFNAKVLAQGLLDLGKAPDGAADRNAARDYYQRQAILFEQGPMARLMRRLFVAANAADLARVGTYERMIFSSNPTSRQRGIDLARYNAAMAEFKKEEAAWIEIAQGLDFGLSNGSMMVSDPRTQLKPLDTQGVSFALHRGDMTGLGMINLRRGKDALGSQGTITQMNLAGPERAFLNGATQPKRTDPNDPFVNLSPDTKVMMAAVQQLSQEQGPIAITKEFEEILINPDQKDPLSFLVSDILIDYAQQEKLDVVACLTDPAFTWSSFITSEQQPRLNMMIGMLQQATAIEIEKQGGWAIITPANRHEDELNFTPRKPLADMMKSIQKNRSVDMEDYATYAFRTGRISRIGLGETYMAMFDRSVVSAMDNNDWNALRLYGSLSEKERTAVSSGGEIPFGRMSPEQRAVIDRMIYNDELRSETRDSETGYTYGSGVIEPTETYAKGFPIGSSLVGRSREKANLVVYGRGKDGVVRPLRTIQTYAIPQLESEILGNPEAMKIYSVSGFTGYAPGITKSIVLRLLIEPKVWREAVLTVNIFNRSATPVTWDKLPDDMVSQIKISMDQYKKQKATDRKGPPPPRGI